MSAQKQQINLLPSKGLEANTMGRVLIWILSSFRIIVIVTEIIVMIAFLSRFWLDAQNSDLSDDIEHKVAVLKASTESEKNFRNTQKRVDILSQLLQQPFYNQLTNKLTTLTPDDVIVSQISFNYEGDYKIEGITPNELSVQRVLVNLQASDSFEDVVINKIETPKDTNLLSFSISFKYKEKID